MVQDRVKLALLTETLYALGPRRVAATLLVDLLHLELSSEMNQGMQQRMIDAASPAVARELRALISTHGLTGSKPIDP